MTTLSKTFTAKKRVDIFTTMIIICLVLFEVFSFSSSVKALDDVWGSSMRSWSVIIAWAFLAVDFGGIGKLFTGEQEQEQSNVWLGWAWAITAIGDTFLAYLAISINAASRADHILVTSGVVSVNTFVHAIPIAIAVLIWFIQVALIVTLNKIIDKLIEERGSHENN